MNRLKTIREKKGLSSGQLAARASIPTRLISDYEDGRQPIPLPHARLLAKALWVKVEDILPPATPPGGIAPPASPPTPPPPPSVLPSQGGVQPTAPMQPPPSAPPSQDGDQPVQAQMQTQAGYQGSFGSQRDYLPQGGGGFRPQGGPPKPRTGGKPIKPVKPKQEPIILPATEGQVTEIIRQGNRAGLDPEAVATEVGKPLTELDRGAARQWIRTMRERAANLTAEQRSSPDTARLPDDREPQYLEQQRKSGAVFSFTMFDGSIFTGPIKLYSPYTIVLRGEDEREIVLRKLAIAYYQQIGVDLQSAELAAAEDGKYAETRQQRNAPKGEVEAPSAPAAEAGLAEDGQPGFFGPDSEREISDSKRDDVADAPGEEPLPAVQEAQS